MDEKNNKISLLTKLDDIIFNSYINTEIVEYLFHSAYLLILNYIELNVKNDTVKITLHLDEIVLELYSESGCFKSFSLPYEFVSTFCIFLEEDTNDDKSENNAS